MELAYLRSAVEYRHLISGTGSTQEAYNFRSRFMEGVPFRAAVVHIM